MVMTILNKTPIYSDMTSIWILFTILFLFFSILGWIEIYTTSSAPPVTYVLSLLFTLGAVIFAFNTAVSIINPKFTGKYTYEVTFSDDFLIKNVINDYKIVEIRDKIVVLEDINPVEDIKVSEN